MNKSKRGSNKVTKAFFFRDFLLSRYGGEKTVEGFLRGFSWRKETATTTNNGRTAPGPVLDPSKCEQWHFITCLLVVCQVSALFYYI